MPRTLYTSNSDRYYIQENWDDLGNPNFDGRYMISAAPEDEIFDMMEDLAGSVGITRKVSRFISQYDRRNLFLQEELKKYLEAKEVKLQLNAPTTWNNPKASCQRGT